MLLYRSLNSFEGSAGIKMNDARANFGKDIILNLPNLQGSNMEKSALLSAIAFHRAKEADADRDLGRGLNSILGHQEPPESAGLLGPTKSRGDVNGVVSRYDKIICQWGDTERVDMTFSVTKSYLSVLVGIALEERLIRDIDDPVRIYTLDTGFDSKQNQNITWRHLLQQASEWEGTLWSKPDLIDRNRIIGIGVDNSKKGSFRALQKPGQFYEYNDVRVNRLALSLMQVFRRPLPEVLKKSIMDPIGSSETWEWHGYENSWVEIDGQKLQSVSGGGHWGGGLWISSLDHARFGNLILNQGRWNDIQIVNANWIKEMCQPSPCNPNYGLLWWLNTKQKLYPSAPETSIFAIGAGENIIWIDRDLHLVAVFRWIEKKSTDELIARIMTSIL